MHSRSCTIHSFLECLLLGQRASRYQVSRRFYESSRPYVSLCVLSSAVVIVALATACVVIFFIPFTEVPGRGFTRLGTRGALVPMLRGQLLRFAASSNGIDGWHPSRLCSGRSNCLRSTCACTGSTALRSRAWANNFLGFLHDSVQVSCASSTNAAPTRRVCVVPVKCTLPWVQSGFRGHSLGIVLSAACSYLRALAFTATG